MAFALKYIALFISVAFTACPTSIPSSWTTTGSTPTAIEISSKTGSAASLAGGCTSDTTSTQYTALTGLSTTGTISEANACYVRALSTLTADLTCEIAARAAGASAPSSYTTLKAAAEHVFHNVMELDLKMTTVNSATGTVEKCLAVVKCVAAGAIGTE